MTLIFLSLGWLVGLYLGQVAAAAGQQAGDEQILPSLLGALWPILAALAGLSAFLARDDRRLRVTALAVGVGLLGVWRTMSLVPEPDPLLTRIGSVVIQGTVASRPEVRDTSQLLSLQVDQIWRDGSSDRVGARVLIRTDRYGDWDYGDRLVAWGELRPVDGSPPYWAEYLARQGIHTTLEYPALRLQDRSSSPNFQRLLDGLRDRLEQVCAALLPEPHASLLAGVLVGSRAGCARK